MEQINGMMWMFAVALGLTAAVIVGGVSLYFWLKKKGREEGY